MTAEDTRTAWQRRYDEHSALIEAHPMFRSLVVAVAAAEAPARPPRLHFTRGGPAYWLTRGTEEPTTWHLASRARVKAGLIADDIEPPDVGAHWHRNDWVARVYVQARYWVEARRIPKPGCASRTSEDTIAP